MTRENGVPIPGPLRASLQDEPPQKRRRLENVWEMLPESEQGDPVVPDVDAAWQELSERIDRSTAPDRRTDRPPQMRRDRSLLWRRVGAGAFVVAALVAAGLWMLYRPAIHEAGPGEQRSVRLADGSVVELNSDTRLRVARSFQNRPLVRSDARRVSLDGEAFFRVEEDTRPFVVETNEAVIRVTGTEFNVRTRSARDGRSTTVTLVSGSLIVAPSPTDAPAVEGDADSIALNTPGATASVTASTLIAVPDPSERPALDHVLAWRRAGFAFIDTPIETILDEVERRFDVRIEPRSGVRLAEPMNLFYSRGVGPEDILNDICIEQDCKYRPTSRGFALVPGERTVRP